VRVTSLCRDEINKLHELIQIVIITKYLIELLSIQQEDNNSIINTNTNLKITNTKLD
jgi:hypothetical protein